MRFVVGLDGSGQALAGAHFVASLPLGTDDEVLITSIIVRPVLLGARGLYAATATPEFYARVWESAVNEAHRAVESGTAALAGIGCTVRQLVREGHPIGELIALVREFEADVVVVGPHGRGQLESILLGSVSQSLLHDMPASVLVAREPVHQLARILLATDGSPHSLAAAHLLARMPLPPDARIHVVAVTDGVHPRHAEHGAADLRDLVALERRGAGDVIEQTVEVLEAAGRSGEPVIRHGDPKREILAAARELEADLVVTGARGVGGFRGLVLGSVSRAVSKAASCSTLVVASRMTRARTES